MPKEKINCLPCMEDDHNRCTNEDTCLCAHNNHGQPKFVLSRMNSKEPLVYESALQDEEYLEKLLSGGFNRDTGNTVGIAVEIISLLISSRHLTSKIEIKEEIQNWASFYGVEFNMPLDAIIDSVWKNPELFSLIKKISYNRGLRKEAIMFDQSQITEVSTYLMGRYQIKRIELTGNLIFFNDKYYEINAEQLIRRSARTCMIKSKNGDMNEVVKMIEDSCPIITWQDIEDSIHLKCLLNGTYDIKEGVFTESFDPNNIILNQIPHEYDIENTFENIDNKVKEIISDNHDRQSYYDSLSIALHPYTGIDFQFGGVGQAGTGKSQICQLSIMTLGDQNVSAAPIHQVANDLTTQKDVAFKFLNIDMDMSNETIRNIDVLKRWITQDKFTARGIYEHNVTFRPMARLCFMANDLYEIANDDDADAIYERTHIIKMENKFRGETKQIRNLFQKIATPKELSGFITYLLRNTTDIYRNQRIHHPINKITVRDTWNLHGNRIKEFIETWTTKGDFREETSEVWSRWLAFTNLKGYKAKDKKKFHTIFDEIVGSSPTKTRIDNQQVWAFHGFRLLRDEEINATSRLFKFDEKDGQIYGASQARSSVSYALSLLNINLKNHVLLKNKIDSKTRELTELLDECKRVGL